MLEGKKFSIFYVENIDEFSEQTIKRFIFEKKKHIEEIRKTVILFHSSILQKENYNGSSSK